jgi:uncharacterized protein YbcI
MSSEVERSRTTTISNAIVALHREFYGRGATKARTVIGADTVFCLMEDIFTPAERTLIAAGRYETVRTARSEFQDALMGRFVAIVEQTVRRQVVGFLSQIERNGYGVEFFVLDGPLESGDGPRAGGGASRDGDGRAPLDT